MWVRLDLGLMSYLCANTARKWLRAAVCVWQPDESDTNILTEVLPQRPAADELQRSADSRGNWMHEGAFFGDTFNADYQQNNDMFLM